MNVDLWTIFFAHWNWVLVLLIVGSISSSVTVRVTRK